MWWVWVLESRKEVVDGYIVVCLGCRLERLWEIGEVGCLVGIRGV